MTDIVIREVTKDVWTFSRPFTLFDWIPIGGRSTAIKLSDGSVWVIASTPLSDETNKTLNDLGPVKYIVSPNGVHWMFLGEYKDAFPDAKLLGTQMAAKKALSKGWKFDGVLGSDPADTQYGFENDVRAWPPFYITNFMLLPLQDQISVVFWSQKLRSRLLPRALKDYGHCGPCLQLPSQRTVFENDIFWLDSDPRQHEPNQLGSRFHDSTQRRQQRVS
ncbi:hypothetical protein HGRIS_002208 [Hohenbuehelia grisea]|uniref:DUF4336 domain-containing protein n=1 Tax=Hohenbuehelia grisea TaxID=104357 RepID=A0ABR3JLT4_9AGAR